MRSTPTAPAVPIWRVIGWTEKVYQPAPGMPYRAAGSCEQCGQGIRYVVTVKNQLGQTIYVQKYRCEDGALLVWFSKGGEGSLGEWVEISGTVKGHEERHGEEQTIMTRCKVRDCG